jgi:hypothetical protein
MEYLVRIAGFISESAAAAKHSVPYKPNLKLKLNIISYLLILIFLLAKSIKDRASFSAKIIIYEEYTSPAHMCVVAKNR